MSEFLDGLGSEVITCWTVQHGAVWEQLQRQGAYQTNAAHIDQPEFRPAYDWLCAQHRQRIPGATGCYPVWAYVRINRLVLRNHCRDAAEDRSGNVLLECQVPRSEVLLSDYDTWHAVLNNSYIDPDDDPDATEAWWDKTERRYQLPRPHPRPYPPALQAELEASWQRIFNVEHWLKLFPSMYIQATFETLRLEYVRRMWPVERPGVHTNRRIGAIVRQL